MPCPNCDHTMGGLGKLESGDIIYWCPRCGTIRRKSPEKFETDETPKLVTRSRNIAAIIQIPEAEREAAISQSFDSFAYRIGFYEACLLPDNRPKPAAVETLERCERCDGCGRYEGGKTIQTHCEVCNGTGVVRKSGAV